MSRSTKMSQTAEMSQTVKKLLYIITQGPYSNSVGQEALDAILIGTSFEQHISVLFMHDGVFQIKSPQRLDQSPQRKEIADRKDSPERVDSSPERVESSPEQLESSPERLESFKDYTKTYTALADFGVEACYVLGSSLGSRGLQLNELSIQPTVLDEIAVADLIRHQFRVFTF